MEASSLATSLVDVNFTAEDEGTGAKMGAREIVPEMSGDVICEPAQSVSNIASDIIMHLTGAPELITRLQLADFFL